MMISALILAYCLADPWCHLPLSRVVAAGDGCNTCTEWRTPGSPRYDLGFCTLLFCGNNWLPVPPRWYEAKP